VGTRLGLCRAWNAERPPLVVDARRTFPTRAAAQKHERAVQFFKRKGG
jgi:hypothetical protein